MLAIALPDLAEPGVSLLAPKINFGTLLYQKKSELVQFCTNFLEHKNKFFCLEHSLSAAPIALKDDGLFLFLYFFLVILQPKKGASIWRQTAFLRASTWRHLALFCDITQTPGSAWASTESDSRFPLCSSDSFSWIRDFCVAR